MPRRVPLVFYWSELCLLCIHSLTIRVFGKTWFWHFNVQSRRDNEKEHWNLPHFLPYFSGVETLKTGIGEIPELMCGLPWKYKRGTCPVENYVPAFFSQWISWVFNSGHRQGNRAEVDFFVGEVVNPPSSSFLEVTSQLCFLNVKCVTVKNYFLIPATSAIFLSLFSLNLSQSFPLHVCECVCVYVKPVI